MIKLTKKTLADELNVAVSTIELWQREGLQHHREGRSNVYKLKEVLDFLLARQGSARLDAGQERAKLHKSQRLIKELEYKVLAQQYVPVEQVEHFMSAVFMNTRAHLLSLPNKLAPAVISCSSLPEITDTTRGLIYECLEELVEQPAEVMMRSNPND